MEPKTQHENCGKSGKPESLWEKVVDKGQSFLSHITGSSERVSADNSDAEPEPVNYEAVFRAAILTALSR